jgi:hypothetical protein
MPLLAGYLESDKMKEHSQAGNNSPGNEGVAPR